MPRRSRPLPIILTWISAVGVLAIVTVGWWTGRPLSLELAGTITAFWAFTVRSDLSFNRRLGDRDRAVKELAVRKGMPDARVETVYALVEAELDSERRRQRALERTRP